MHGTGRTILITGASRGLGRAMTSHLVANGDFVIGTYRSARAEADALVAELADAPGRVSFLPYDARESDPADLATQVGELARTSPAGRLDALVANAGIGTHVPFADTSRDQLDELIDIQIRAPFLLTQAVLPLLSDGARILLMSSGLARFTLPGYAAYAATKGAIEVLTRYLAAELGERGIRVNCIAPGATETDFSGGAVRDNADLNQAVAGMVALGRPGQPDDIGAAVLALLSEEMAWMNGERIEVSGGMRL
jgi:NAD(P)-dependent dehydrogenase (short-subunit alcohol dehydrogenase family)